MSISKQILSQFPFRYRLTVKATPYTMKPKTESKLTKLGQSIDKARTKLQALIDQKEKELQAIREVLYLLED